MKNELSTIEITKLTSVTGGFEVPQWAKDAGKGIGSLFGGGGPQINTSVQNGSNNTNVTNTGEGNVTIKKGCP
jgi:hypothetical protein